MKRILVAALGLLATAGIVGSANAADLPRRGPVMQQTQVYSPVYSWTGPYIGINGGYGWNSGSFVSGNGGLIGGTIGYNWQSGAAVFGIEGDLDWTNISGTTTAAAGCAAGCTVSNSWLGTVRGRLGYAVDRFMPYVTGGLAVGDIRANSVLGATSTTNAGYALGAGVEFALAPQWTMKAEYMYVDLGSIGCNAACGPAVGASSASLRANILRAGVNYKF